MRKIGIDARLYNQTGVGVYVKNLIKNLVLIAPEDIQFTIYVLQGDRDRIYLPKKSFVVKEVSERWHTFPEQTTFWWQLMQDDLDLMHFTYFSYPILYRRPFVATVHDLTPLTFKTGRASTKNSAIYWVKHQVFQFVLRSQVENARAIITPTKAVREEMSSVYGENIAAKATPVYEGLDADFITAKENKTLVGKYTEPFFLYVGNFYPHKNVERLIEAFSRTNQDTRLVLCGPDSFFTKRIEDFIKKKNMTERVIMHKNPTREDLVFFYKKARALISPSLSEGFGLPLVEAMHFYLPIIASDIPVFQEITQGYYHPFNPRSIDSIAETVQSFSESSTKIVPQDVLNMYSFEEMAKQTLGIYQNVKV